MMGSFGWSGGRLAAFLTFLCFKINDKERMRVSTRKMVGIESNVRNNRFMFLIGDVGKIDVLKKNTQECEFVSLIFR